MNEIWMTNERFSKDKVIKIYSNKEFSRYTKTGKGDFLCQQ